MSITPRLAPFISATADAAPQSDEALTESVNWLRTNRNANTERAYASGWKGFEAYLQAQCVVQQLLQPAHIAGYLRQRLEVDKVASATLSADCAAIGDRLKFTPQAGMHLHPLVSDTLRLASTLATPSQPKRHMSAELMRAIIAQHDATPASAAGQDWLSTRNVCMVLVMMMGMLRENEAVELRVLDVVCEPANTPGAAANPREPIPLSNVSLFVRASKTDQAGKGAFVLLAAQADAAMCPLRWLQRYMLARDRAGVKSDLLFPAKDGTALAATTPCSLVQKLVQMANEWAQAKHGAAMGKCVWGAPSEYGSHSLRRGGVTEARKSGVDMLAIQRHGRWKSLAVLRYVGPEFEQRLGVTRNLFAAVTTASSSLSGKPLTAWTSPTTSAPSPAASSSASLFNVRGGTTVAITAPLAGQSPKSASPRKGPSSPHRNSAPGSAGAAAGLLFHPFFPRDHQPPPGHNGLWVQKSELRQIADEVAAQGRVAPLAATVTVPVVASVSSSTASALPLAAAAAAVDMTTAPGPAAVTVTGRKERNCKRGQSAGTKRPTRSGSAGHDAEYRGATKRAVSHRKGRKAQLEEPAAARVRRASQLQAEDDENDDNAALEDALFMESLQQGHRSSDEEEDVQVSKRRKQTLRSATAAIIKANSS